MNLIIVNPFDAIEGDQVPDGRYMQLARLMAASGHQVDIITSDFFHLKKTKRTPPGKIKNIRIHLVKTISYTGNTSLCRIVNHFQFAWGAHRISKKLLKKQQISGILTSCPPILASFLQMKLCLANNVPLITDIRDAWPISFKSLIKPTFIYYAIQWGPSALLKKIFAASRLITTVDQAFADLFKLPNAKVFYLGTTTSDYPQPQFLPSYRMRLVYIGNYYHNPQLELFAHSISKLDEFQLVLIGEGNISAYPKSENVFFEPAKFGEDLANRLNEFDAGVCFVNPGLHIYFPNKAFFYLSAGLPVISNIEDGSFAQLLKDENLGIVSNIKTLIEDLNKLALLSTPNEKRRIHNFAIQHLDRKRIMSDYLRALEQIIKR